MGLFGIVSLQVRFGMGLSTEESDTPVPVKATRED